MKRIRDYFFPDGISGGCDLFSYLSIPGGFSKQVLSILLYNKCGSRYVSPVVDGLDSMEMIAETLKATFDYKWKTLYETVSLEYNPIENYSMTETETQTDIDSIIKNGNSSGEASNETNSEFTDSKSVYGFNSSTPHSDNDTNQKQAVSSDGTSQDEFYENESRSASGDRTLTRSGNIGVMSTQDMISQERDIARYSYIMEVIDDIASLISIKIW